MKELVEKIIQNSKKTQADVNPKQLYYREFDAALRLASNRVQDSAFEWHLGHMVRFGQEAGFSAEEISRRKETLYWALSTNPQ